ncbi:MAG: hypothetical protein LBT05_09240 [Planctomycetaceae bacterium]|nr:hypothetical protein [Planctomycetaceae bacterium]
MNAVLAAIRQLGLDNLIAREPSCQRNLVLAMIVQRIIAPRSKLGTTREWNNTTLADELNIDTKKENADSLDAAMDWFLRDFAVIGGFFSSPLRDIPAKMTVLRLPLSQSSSL